ncbi:MAG: helix-turn-helix domain-containing protein [Clostridia bacterium]|nr:helix-turn-helix domain-containing protein [Clostridia bacterium]
MNRQRKPDFTDNPAAITMKQFSRLYQIDISSAYKLAKQPGFPAVRVSKQKILIPVKELEKWLADHKNA